MSHLSPGEVWETDCPRCGAHTHVRFDFCTLYEYVERRPVAYAVTWLCPRCTGKFTRFVAVEGARIALAAGAKHVAMRAPIEVSPGGPLIADDDLIDLMLALEPGPDEGSDAVMERVWKELIGDTESKEDHPS